MTNLEFINEFDIAYNNTRSNSAPGLDLYEQSVFLTKAQEQIVFNYFNPNSNIKREGFENTEKRRRDLEKIVKNYTIGAGANIVLATSTGVNLKGLDSYFISIPDNLFFITQEKVILSVDRYATVIPMSHDELMLQVDNPFRKPKDNLVSVIVWRVDNSLGTFDESVEIVIPEGATIQTYQMRYVEKPEPIVLVDLSTEFAWQGLSVDGVTAETSCKLNSIVHRQILDRAVDMAIEAFEKTRIQTHPMIASRNE
jgi:hypothetical protein